MRESEFYRMRRVVEALHPKFDEQHAQIANLTIQIKTMQRIIEHMPGFNEAFNAAKKAYEIQRDNDQRRKQEGKKLSKKGDGG